MLLPINQIRNKILDVKYGRIKQGLKMGIEPIDNHLRFAPASFDIIIGHSNVGKTTFIIYLFVVWAIKHQLKFIVWSSENTPDSIVRKIIEFKMGKPVQKSTDEEITEALTWCDKHFKIINVDRLYTYKDVLEEIKGINDAYPCDAALIDPYNSLAKDKDAFKSFGGHEYDYLVCSTMRLFTAENNITIYLNCHGVTDALRKVYPKGHEYEGYPMPLMGSQVEGGGKFLNRSNQLFSLHRMTQHPELWMYTQLHTLKVKEIESYGAKPTVLDEPLQFRMQKNNVGFEFCGRDLLHEKKDIKQLEF